MSLDCLAAFAPLTLEEPPNFFHLPTALKKLSFVDFSGYPHVRNAYLFFYFLFFFVSFRFVAALRALIENTIEN